MHQGIINDKNISSCADQVDEIKQAMSGFSLPPSAIPEWAKHVPENVWKSELIKGIRTKIEDK